ncbi:MAG: tryptophan-rich sensory protein TspO [Gemmobacter sp.]
MDLGFDWGLFLTFLTACGAAAATGAMFEPGAWYKELRKPRWTPPGWVFPLTWTVLYLCMAASAARIAMLPDSGQALAFWAAQIAFNTLWTPVFFGLHRIRAAMVVMVGLWTTVALTLVSFWALDPVAGWLFAPYLVWVTIAGALNFTVWRMNPGVGAAA